MSNIKEQIKKDLEHRHELYKIMLEAYPDPNNRHAIDLIARMREVTSLIKYIDSLTEMSNIEKIRQEIERRIKSCDATSKTPNQLLWAELSALLPFIDSLPEEKPSEDLNKLIQKWDRIDINTVLKVKVKATGKVIDGFYDGRGHFDHFIDHDIFDRYSIDEVELIPEEEPSKDLEEEMDRYFDTMQVFEHENIFEETFHKIARHFAEWGAKHLK